MSSINKEGLTIVRSEQLKFAKIKSRKDFLSLAIEKAEISNHGDIEDLYVLVSILCEAIDNKDEKLSYISKVVKSAITQNLAIPFGR